MTVIPPREETPPSDSLYSSEPGCSLVHWHPSPGILSEAIPLAPKDPYEEKDKVLGGHSGLPSSPYSVDGGSSASEDQTIYVDSPVSGVLDAQSESRREISPDRSADRSASFLQKDFGINSSPQQVLSRQPQPHIPSSTSAPLEGLPWGPTAFHRVHRPSSDLTRTTAEDLSSSPSSPCVSPVSSPEAKFTLSVSTHGVFTPSSSSAFSAPPLVTPLPLGSTDGQRRPPSSLGRPFPIHVTSARIGGGRSGKCLPINLDSCA